MAEVEFYLTDTVKLAFLAFSSYIVCIFLVKVHQRPSDVYPPGPPSRPLIGNLHWVKAHGAWRDLTGLKEIYGDLIFFHGLGTRILVLNNLETIEDLLDKRATTYSDRPVFTVVSELMGLGQSMGLLPYGKDWRTMRKMAHSSLRLSAIKKYCGIQEDLSALLNLSLLDDPNNFYEHVRLAAGRIVLAITYGIPVIDADHQYIRQAEETMDIIGKSMFPGAYICDLLPFLKHSPAWLPFQLKAAYGKMMIDTSVTAPLEHVKRRMAEGSALPSLARDLLQDDTIQDRKALEHNVKWTAGSMFAGELS
ncbi:hypothetical protein H0H87_000402 [Tephrocybe sp. NHM501043]|nr:hypothetical protein H0H87_000402 [Tephrocybe sp. NHM501043]